MESPEATALDVAKRMCCSCSAGIIAALATNPTETLRIRWQVSSLSAYSADGLVSFAARILRNEGLVRGLWLPGCTGWMASVGGAFGLRMGSYETVRGGLERVSGMQRSSKSAFIAGLCTGSLTNSLCCPFFLAKNRLQARAGLAEASGGESLLKELAAIIQEDGLTGLYKGVPALFLRGGLIAGGQLFGYDSSKRLLMRQGYVEGPTVHVLSSSVSAVTATLASAPADVVLNRYHAGSTLGRSYSSMSAVIAELMREEGPLAFYRGVTPNIAKFLPLFLCSMPLYEQLRNIFGLGYLK